MFLGRNELEKWASSGGIAPYSADAIGDRPNEIAIDVSLGWIQPYEGASLPNPKQPLPGDFYTYVKPGECRLALLEEYIQVPDDLVGMFSIRSEWAQLFLQQIMSVLIKPGWNGHLIAELVNHSRHEIFLKRGDRIGQISLCKVSY